jgi:hypothetical protein
MQQHLFKKIQEYGSHGTSSCAAVYTWAHHHQSPNLTFINRLPGELHNVTNCMQHSPSTSQEI